MKIDRNPQGAYTPATGSSSDPVGRHGEADWGFWDETWCDWHGGYADEAAARDGLREYAKTL